MSAWDYCRAGSGGRVVGIDVEAPLLAAARTYVQEEWNFYPPSPTWPRLKQIIEAAFALRSDINIGRRTYGMLRRAGLEDVTIRAAVLALQDSHPYMRLPIVGVTAMRPRIVEAGIATDAELDELLAHVEQRVSDPETFQITFTLTQVWGRKPRHSA